MSPKKGGRGIPWALSTRRPFPAVLPGNAIAGITGLATSRWFKNAPTIGIIIASVAVTVAVVAAPI